MTKASDRIGAIARERYQRPVPGQEEGTVTCDQCDPRAIVDYLDEQHDDDDGLLSQGWSDDGLEYRRHYRNGSVTRWLIPAIEDRFIADRLVLLGDFPGPERATLERIPTMPPLPRGMVAIETDGRIELWFTNEVKPPEWVKLGHVDIVSAVDYQAGRKWEDVERWRFKP